MIITCPKCHAMGRTERETMAWVTCPRAACGHGFLAWPPGTTIDAEAELRERRFVCAVHDRPFWVVFGRHTKNELYQVMKMHGQQGWLGAALLKRERERLAAATSPGTALIVRNGTTALTIAAPAPSFGQMLARVFVPPPSLAETASVRWQRPTAEQVIATMRARAGDADELDFSEVDLDGFFCLHCGIEALGHTHFIFCRPRCQELVCAGRSELHGSGFYFRCRSSCGCADRAQEAAIAVGGERFAVPQAAGRDGLLTHAPAVRIGHDQPRRLR